MESARADDDPLYAAYVLVLVLGLRKGEMLGLIWADVDLDAGELTIDRQLQRVGAELLHRETKTAASDGCRTSAPWRSTAAAPPRPPPKTPPARPGTPPT
ncbi:hypothetical protein ACLQ22_20715 [Micromonospora sp. DT178]|uniref:hypothetical protein n=1 Tax=Micromonospora sp. DT178 TaxID=3393436 RepID=UPI003CF89BB4